jgi:hypothetical protein
MVITRTIYEKAAELTFSGVYNGRQVDLTVIPADDRFAVQADGVLIGQIKIGYDRHTWLVTDSKFVEQSLVKEIGQRILNEYY